MGNLGVSRKRSAGIKGLYGNAYETTLELDCKCAR
jgi:hypothetical protein